jgi:hypothetical protein
MKTKDQQNAFNEIHHALLFAWIGKAIIERISEQRGEAIIRKVIRQYGEERGQRMALRAKAKKHVLSMVNYFGYSEYRITPGVMDMKIIKQSPHAKLCVSKCPWHKCWSNPPLRTVDFWLVLPDHQVIPLLMAKEEGI